MSQKCKQCGFSEATETDLTETPYTSPAHLLSYIGSNDPPPHAQETQFRRMLSGSVASLRELDDRIATMQHELRTLLRQRRGKEREIDDYKSVLHPIRRLPQEILCEIFLSFVTENLDDCNRRNDEELVSTLNPSSTIWILPQISSYWRSIALSFPRMWSTVILITGNFDLNQLSEAIRMLGAQLYRSDNHQLSISITSRLDIRKSHPLLELLFSTSRRWKELSIHATIESLESFSPLRGSLPAMTTLHVWAKNNNRNFAPSSTLSMFEFTPKLTTLVGHPHVLYKLSFPFSQILEYGRDLRCTCVSHAALLSRMPNVEHITASCFPNNKLDLARGLHPNNLPRAIALPYLRRAALLGDGGRQGKEHSSTECALLLRLTLPALKELEIGLFHSIDGLRGLLQRSRCSLDKLTLRIYGLPDDARIDILKDVPTLTSLTLRCPPAVITKFMEEISRSTLVVPSLRSLTLENSCGFDSVQIEELKTSRSSLSLVEIEGVRY
ncbi:hypothetical protein C8J56DRAFT_240126 [Mycena floridula]|nr:hypothetical protein C8J56DRAFT_240126 [Mycena floridula]